MSRNYDNWERLVEAVLDREKLRQLARQPSFGSTISDFSSRFSFDSPSTLKEYEPELPKPFSYNELKKATRNFRPVRLLGEGKSWYDFHGRIDEQTLTAAKPGSGLTISVKLETLGFKDNKQWLSEVNYARQLCHPNLVKLIGYCSEGYNRLLVYEFMPRGSLEMHLLCGSGRSEMTWEKRVNVAIGVARGLSFLHDRETAVINRDIRASSIFIDGDFNAKLNGFSLAEPEAAVVAGLETVHPNYNLSRYQHVAPEYIISGLLTAESNVYSFGVVLLQLLCGRSTFDPTRVPGEQNLVNWATSSYLKDKKKLFQIMDSKLEGKYHRKDAYAVADLALRCLWFEPRIRPSMKEVLAALEHLKLSSKS